MKFGEDDLIDLIKYAQLENNYSSPRSINGIFNCPSRKSSERGRDSLEHRRVGHEIIFTKNTTNLALKYSSHRLQPLIDRFKKKEERRRTTH